MAASGLNHLKNDYRRRFCQPSRAPDINTEQGQNMLEILQNCFEEKNLISDFIIDSAKSVLYSTPKINDNCIQSPNKEGRKSHPKAFPISSRKKESSVRGLEPSEAASRSVQSRDRQKVLAADASLKSTPDLKNKSSEKLNDHCTEADEEFYLSIGSPAGLLDAESPILQNVISSAQKRETYTFGNSINFLASSTQISHKTKKRLNFEDKDTLEKVEENKISEVEDKRSEEQKNLSETSQRRIQDKEREIQPQAKKSFSTLFLETVKRKSESSPIIRHVAAAPPHSSLQNDTKLLDDEFIIDELATSFAPRSWITIPKKGGPLKQHVASSAESTAVLQGKKSREEHHSVSSKTQSSGNHSREAHLIEKSQHPDEKLDTENTKKTNSTKKDKEEFRKKHFPSGSKNNELVPEEMTSTVLRSHRISRRPSDWWVVKSEESPVHSNSPLRNELPVYNNSRQKLAKNASPSSKNTVKKTIPSKKRKKATHGTSRVQKFLSVQSSRSVNGCDKISDCSQNELLEHDKTRVAKKKYLDHSRITGYSKDQVDVVTTQNIHLKSQSSKYISKSPVETNLDSGESRASVLEESGPSRLKNHLISGKNNSYVNDEAPGTLDDSRLKRFKVTPDKKIHHKLVLPSNTPNVRRTKRIRLKPLEYWRGERVDYQETPSGGLLIGGILSPDTVTSKRKAKGNVGKVSKITNRKRIRLDNDERKNRLVVNQDIPLGDPLQPTWVKDPETREIVLMDLVRPRDTYQFFVEHGELKVYKTLDTPFFSTGKLILGPYEEKGKQHVGEDILVFYVIVGDLLCTLHETPYIITAGDSFYVPAGNYYNIKNLLNEESILHFTQIKR
ncbi:centromere protein C [Ctenodactylus gundi]